MKKLLYLIVFALAGCGEAPSEDRTSAGAPARGADEVGHAAQIREGVAGIGANATRPDARADSGAGAAGSERFHPGTHYEVVEPAAPTSSDRTKIEVAEILWYGCSHCYEFEPHFSAWLADKPPYVNVVRIPALWSPLVRSHARAFYAAEQLGILGEMHQAFFTEIHVNGNPLDTEAKLAEFFSKHDVGADEFRSAFDSAAVEAKVQRAEELLRHRYQIKAVPSIVVNGRYVSNATLAGGYEQLIEVLDALVELEHARD